MRNLTDKAIATIRTAVPAATAWLLGLLTVKLARLGISLDTDTVGAAATALSTLAVGIATAAWYRVARWAGDRWPGLRWLLGVSVSPPVYPRRAR